MLEQGEPEQSNVLYREEWLTWIKKFATETPSHLIPSNEMVAEFMQLRIAA
jgi:hypothetical protein